MADAPLPQKPSSSLYAALSAPPREADTRRSPHGDAAVTRRLYDWKKIRTSKIKPLLEECYNKPYIYNRCDVPWVVRDFLGSWISPPERVGDPDVLDPSYKPDYVITMIVRQVTQDAFSANFEDIGSFTEAQLAEVRRWATQQVGKSKEQMHSELLEKRTQEMSIIEQYHAKIEELRRDRRRREAEEAAKGTTASAVAAGTPSATGETEPIEARQRKGGAALPPLGTGARSDATQDDSEEGLAATSASIPTSHRTAHERIAYLRAEKARVEQMKIQVKREEATYSAHIASLPAACKALELLAILFIIPCVFAQDGYAIIITLPIALIVGVWGYTVSHYALRAASLVPYSVVATLCAFGYLVYAVLRSTIWNTNPDDGSDDFQTITLVIIWVVEALLLGIAQYSTSLAGLLKRLEHRKQAPAAYLAAQQQLKKR